jgi:GT2 family glycosyltransferase
VAVPVEQRLVAQEPGEKIESGADPGQGRVVARGKFLWLGDEKFYVRGVTYGTFARDEAGDQFPARETVERDFAAMAAHGINSVRTYTVPPTWLLDLASEHDLRMMIGISWEDHVAFLESRANRESIVRRVQEATFATAGHPAVLCHAIGNEIPSQIARWYGDRRVERFLHNLYKAVKAEDADALVTYVNYPSTEYLELPFLDFASFNIYLESQQRLENYLARLHNIVGDLPLVVAECGYDSYRNGVEDQASVLGWQVESVFRAGAAGCFVFAWTDEWHRGGFEIDDWDFGLTDRRRNPKPALASVSDAYTRLPIAEPVISPRVSVVVCCHNEERTLGQCLAGLEELVYPDYEVIVVDDGSTDGTAAVAEQFEGVRLVSTENRGLAAARNLGLELATGEIVAYIDGDAWPDPHWLTYLVAAFQDSDHVGIGGPNLPPMNAGPVEQCVANAPGGPTHVLVSDGEAEHIPGCNMAFKKDALEAIGGFDPQFRAAGDDVDICWQLRARGWTLGFDATAVVWHRRRHTVRGFCRQQIGYGKAEALLERKWPEKYNATGHVTWAGRLYAKGVSNILYGARSSIYYGVWGTGLFQWRHGGAGRVLRSLPLMPEWYLLLLLLAQISALGFVWHPFLAALPFLVLGIVALVYQACTGAAHAHFPSAGGRPLGRLRLRALTCFLYLAQPVARLGGRLRNGLTLWRRRNSELVLPTLILSEVCVLGAIWRPLLFASPLLAISFVAVVHQTRVGKLDRTDVADPAAPVISKWGRFVARLRAALKPLPPGRKYGMVLPMPRTLALWDEEWRSTSDRLQGVEAGLQATGTVYRHGGGFDRWDLEVRGGMFGGARMRSAIEEHGGGRQLVRFRVWPRASHFAQLGLLLCASALFWAVALSHTVLTAVFAAMVLVVLLRVLLETSSAVAALLPALRHPPKAETGNESAAPAEPKAILRLVPNEPNA